jgi:hypothetical protein
MPTTAAVRWPAVVAGVFLGLLLARRGATLLGGRAGVLVGLCWSGCLGLIDRSEAAGLELVAGLGTVAALDRVLGRGADMVAGFWLALAFLSGGWPPLAVVALATIVIGRGGRGLSWRLALPPLIAAAIWSAWSLRVAPVEAWAAALMLPLTHKSAWLMSPSVLALGLPWTPLAALVWSSRVCEGWPQEGRALIIGWLQVAGACLLAGTLIPGLADAARLPALAGITVTAGACLERILAGAGGKSVRRYILSVAVGMALPWALVVVFGGGYLVAAVAYYRPVAIVLIVLGVATAGLALWSVSRREPRCSVLAMLLLAISLKLAHWGYYVPEWDYRFSQGPWGRAIGQWVPPRWPIFTTHGWPLDLAFASGHPFHQLSSPQHLNYMPGEARFVLLLGPEFENWPAEAPRLIKLATFHDEHDQLRVLGRTEGSLPWTRPIRPRGLD